jgi:hypothetical protein
MCLEALTADMGYYESGKFPFIFSCGKGPIMLLVLCQNSFWRDNKMEHGVGGPFLQTAVFCEKVLQEKDGVLSAIRIVDQFTVSSSVEGTPELMPSINIAASLLITFKSGDIKGKWELKVKPVTPSGQELPGFIGPVMFEGGHRGANVIIQYVLPAKEEGTYWFDVMLNDKLITKMPLKIVYTKAQISTTGQPVH